jgi:small subunit ribosomal protein S20
MANTSSAKKAIRKIARQTAVNKARRSLVRGVWRKVEEAIAAGNAADAAAALKTAESATMRAVSKGVFHKNMGSRKVSRLAGRVKALSAPAR